MSHKRYKPGTPPAKNYPLFGRSSLVLADILARYFGWEVPEWKLEEVSVDEILEENKCHS